MDAPPITRQELDMVYNWVDEIPFSRPKKNISRDFADGVLTAEIMHFFLPRFVDIHNYPAANSATQKYNNWNTLNQKVLKKINFQISKNDIEHIITCTPDCIQRVLKILKEKIEQYLEKSRQKQRERQEDERFAGESGIKQGSSVAKNELSQKDVAIRQLRETIEILELKLKKMDQLSKLKDAKIQTLMSKLQQAGLS